MKLSKVINRKLSLSYCKENTASALSFMHFWGLCLSHVKPSIEVTPLEFMKIFTDSESKVLDKANSEDFVILARISLTQFQHGTGGETH